MGKAFKYVLAGAIATIPMTMAMNSMHKHLPIMESYPLPPRKITKNVSKEIGLWRHLSKKQKDLLTVIGHYSYGAFTGSIYFPFIQKLNLPKIAGGITFGLLVWGVSYLGWLPASGLYPSAKRTPLKRNLLMIAAHIIWGAALGMLYKYEEDNL